MIFKKGDRVRMKPDARRQFPGSASTGVVSRDPRTTDSIAVLQDGTRSDRKWAASHWEHETPMFFVQNLQAGYVGNNPMFWQQGGNGYTSYIDKAERFTEAAAREMVAHDPFKWAAWPVELVESCIYRTVEAQELKRHKPHAFASA